MPNNFLTPEELELLAKVLSMPKIRKIDSSHPLSISQIRPNKIYLTYQNTTFDSVKQVASEMYWHETNSIFKIPPHTYVVDMENPDILAKIDEQNRRAFWRSRQVQHPKTNLALGNSSPSLLKETSNTLARLSSLFDSEARDKALLKNALPKEVSKRTGDILPLTFDESDFSFRSIIPSNLNQVRPTPLSLSQPLMIDNVPYDYHINHLYYGETPEVVLSLYDAHQVFSKTNSKLGKFTSSLLQRHAQSGELFLAAADRAYIVKEGYLGIHCSLNQFLLEDKSYGGEAIFLAANRPNLSTIDLPTVLSHEGFHHLAITANGISPRIPVPTHYFSDLNKNFFSLFLEEKILFDMRAIAHGVSNEVAAEIKTTLFNMPYAYYSEHICAGQSLTFAEMSLEAECFAFYGQLHTKYPKTLELLAPKISSTFYNCIFDNPYSRDYGLIANKVHAKLSGPILLSHQSGKPFVPGFNNVVDPIPVRRSALRALPRDYWLTGKNHFRWGNLPRYIPSQFILTSGNKPSAFLCRPFDRVSPSTLSHYNESSMWSRMGRGAIKILLVADYALHLWNEFKLHPDYSNYVNTWNGTAAFISEFIRYAPDIILPGATIVGRNSDTANRIFEYQLNQVQTAQTLTEKFCAVHSFDNAAQQAVFANMLASVVDLFDGAASYVENFLRYEPDSAKQSTGNPYAFDDNPAQWLRYENEKAHASTTHLPLTPQAILPGTVAAEVAKELFSPESPRLKISLADSVSGPPSLVWDGMNDYSPARLSFFLPSSSPGAVGNRVEIEFIKENIERAKANNYPQPNSPVTVSLTSSDSYTSKKEYLTAEEMRQISEFSFIDMSATDKKGNVHPGMGFAFKLNSGAMLHVGLRFAGGATGLGGVNFLVGGEITIESMESMLAALSSTMAYLPTMAVGLLLVTKIFELGTILYWEYKIDQIERHLRHDIKNTNKDLASLNQFIKETLPLLFMNIHDDKKSFRQTKSEMRSEFAGLIDKIEHRMRYSYRHKAYSVYFGQLLTKANLEAYQQQIDKNIKDVKIQATIMERVIERSEGKSIEALTSQLQTLLASPVLTKKQSIQASILRDIIVQQAIQSNNFAFILEHDFLLKKQLGKCYDLPPIVVPDTLGSCSIDHNKKHNKKEDRHDAAVRMNKIMHTLESAYSDLNKLLNSENISIKELENAKKKFMTLLNDSTNSLKNIKLEGDKNYPNAYKFHREIIEKMRDNVNAILLDISNKPTQGNVPLFNPPSSFDARKMHFMKIHADKSPEDLAKRFQDLMSKQKLSRTDQKEMSALKNLLIACGLENTEILKLYPFLLEEKINGVHIDSVFNEKAVARIVRLGEIRSDFTQRYSDKAPEELISVAHRLADRKVCKDACVVKIESLHELIFNQVLNLWGNNKRDEAIKLLRETLDINYPIMDASQAQDLRFFGLYNLLNELQAHKSDQLSFCLTTLQRIRDLMAMGVTCGDNPNNIPIYEAHFLTTCIQDSAMEKAYAGDYSRVIEIYNSLKNILPENAATYDRYITEFNLMLQSDLSVQSRCERIKLLSEIPAGKTEIDSDSKMLIALHKDAIFEKLRQNIVNGNMEEVFQILSQINETVTDKTFLPSEDKLKMLSEYIKTHANETPDFWINILRELKEKQSTPEDEKSVGDEILMIDLIATEAIIVTLKNIAIAKAQALSEAKSNLGFYREAADALRKLQSEMPDEVQYSSQIKYLDLLHQGQVIDTVIRPLQNALALYVNSMPASKIKTVANVALEAVNIAQTAVPNAITIGLQGIHHHYILGDSETFVKYVTDVGNQLHTDITHPFSNNGVGALIWTQLSLKAIEYIPFEKIGPNSALVKHHVLNLGHLGVNLTFAGNAVGQLVKNGLTHANAPFSLATIAQLGINLTLSGLHNYWSSYGNAVESTSFYKKEEYAKTAVNTASSSAFMFSIMGPWGWLGALGVAAINVVSTAVNYYTGAIETTSCTKALAGSLGNIEYFEKMKMFDNYVMLCTYRLIAGPIQNRHMQNVKDGREIILSKENANYYCYFSDMSGSWTKEKINDAATLSLLSWPASDLESDEKILNNDANFVKIMRIIRTVVHKSALGRGIAVVNTFISIYHVINDYLNKCEYRIKMDPPSISDQKQIKLGGAVLFAREGETYNLYYRSKDGGNVIKSQMDADTFYINQANAVDLDVRREVTISADDQWYLHRALWVTQTVLDSYIKLSRTNIKKSLKETFDGLVYNKDQHLIANAARVLYLQYKVRECFETKNYLKVCDLTNQVNGQRIMNRKYQLPLYMAWQIILRYRLAAYIESRTLLVSFWEQYQALSEGIYESSPTDWREQYWDNEVKPRLEEKVRAALQNLVVAADQTSDLELKLAYLKNIAQKYRYCDNWDRLLNDELKLWAAINYYRANSKDNCRLFLTRITDYKKLLDDKNDDKFSSMVLMMLRELDKGKHASLLSPKSGKCDIPNSTRYVHAIDLIDSGKYEAAAELLADSVNFDGKKYALAKLEYYRSDESNILQALQLLFQETNQDRNYWCLLYTLLYQCVFSARCGSNVKKIDSALSKLYGLLIACKDKIQEQLSLSPGEALKISRTAEQGYNYLIDFVSRQSLIPLTLEQKKKQVENIIAFSHKCMRGENDVNILAELETILSGVAYTICDNALKKLYLPIQVPADGDAIFHVLGTTRVDCIALVDSKVRGRVWLAEKILGKAQDKDVINLLLDYLTLVNDKVYERSESHFNVNVAEILTNLKQWEKSDTLACKENNLYILDVFSLVLESNVSIYIANEKNELKLLRRIHHDDGFATVNILYTSKNGFTSKLNECNHFTKLAYLPVKCEEIVVGMSAEKSGDIVQLASATLTLTVEKPKVSTRHVSTSFPSGFFAPAKPPAPFYAVVHNKKLTFSETEVRGDGWCALHAAGIKQPQIAVMQLKKHLSDSRIVDWIRIALENNLRAREMGESFNLVGEQGALFLARLVMLEAAIKASNDNSSERIKAVKALHDFLSEPEVQIAYINYLLQTKYVDQNIAAACLHLIGKKLAAFRYNGTQSKKLFADLPDDFDPTINIDQVVCIILKPGKNQWQSHYNRLSVTKIESVELTSLPVP